MGDSMKNLYMDNGATSFPKAPGVSESMCNYLNHVGASVNRGVYHNSHEAENTLYETRELLCSLFDFDQPENVVFTKNVTESLNVLLKGLFRKGDHVIVSSVEHNAVMRPLNALKERGIDYTRIMCDSNGAISGEDILPAIKPNTKAVVMTHASNVSGTILSLEKVGSICKKNGLNFIIDVAQTAGLIPVDFPKLGADAVAFTGHKSLLGPQGVGGFLITNQLADQMFTFIEGGTGSLSDHEIQPHYMPDKFEAGTQNMPGIYGLNAALKYIMKEGTETLHHKEMALMEIFLEALMNMDHIRIVGRKDTEQRVGIVSVDFIHGDNGEMAYRLYSDYGIMTRSGMHCAPSAHKTLGTFPRGTVRFGLSHFMEKADILYAIDQINKLR